MKQLDHIPASLTRTSSFLTHPVFNTHHSESQMMRYIKLLENKDLSLNTSMISLGSCTMKLNAATEMIPVSWPQFSRIHPFAPANQAEGYQYIINELSEYLCEITALMPAACSPTAVPRENMQDCLPSEPIMRAGRPHRNVILIPISAHGTNPASAVMAG